MSDAAPGYRFPEPLVPATLIRRYKRFLADVRFDDGTEAVAHCPNPGSMTGLADPGMRVWLEPNDDPRKKLKFGWRLAALPGGHWAGIDTGVPNRVVGAALAAGAVPELAGYSEVRPEVPYGDRSRVDFLLTGPDRPDAYVEVKSVTLMRTDGLAEFPDTETKRGARHLQDLAGAVRRGARGMILYLVQRTDCDRVALAADIDPGYAAAAEAAGAAGVEILCYGTRIDRNGVWISGALPNRIAG